MEYVLNTRTSKDMVKFLKKMEGKCDTDGAEEIYPQYMGRWCSVYGADSCLEF